MGNQTAEPQRIAATTTILTPPPPAVAVVAAVGQTEESSSGGSSSVRKYLGSRSPSGQSPVTKSRKTPQYSSVSLGGSSSSGSTVGSGSVAGAATVAAAANSCSSGGSVKDSHSDKEIGSPKSRTWKGLVARQFRKIQGQPSSPNANFVQLPDGASIGVPLAQCPMVSFVIFFFYSFSLLLI